MGFHPCRAPHAAGTFLHAVRGFEQLFFVPEVGVEAADAYVSRFRDVGHREVNAFLGNNRFGGVDQKLAAALAASVAAGRWKRFEHCDR